MVYYFSVFRFVGRQGCCCVLNPKSKRRVTHFLLAYISLSEFLGDGQKFGLEDSLKMTLSMGDSQISILIFLNQQGSIFGITTVSHLYDPHTSPTGDSISLLFQLKVLWRWCIDNGWQKAMEVMIILLSIGGRVSQSECFAILIASIFIIVYYLHSLLIF